MNWNFIESPVALLWRSPKPEKAVVTPGNSPESPAIRNTLNTNLDLLRTMAVFYVIGFHLLLFFKKGNLGSVWAIGRWGVLLFFVHTSLVLMFSIERQEQKLPGTGIVWPFYVRRAFRILPLSMLVVSLVFVSAMPVGHLYNGQFQAVHLTKSGLVANLFLVQNLTGAESITAPLWSLPYEIEMYLLLPLLYLLIRASKSLGSVFGIWLISLLLAGTAYRVFHFSYPSFIMFVPCFVSGVVSYKMSQAANFRLPFVAFPIVIAVVTCLYVHAPTVPCSWAWCLVVGISIPFFSEIPYQWMRIFCQTVARYSYGIYLTHFACIWFAFAELVDLPVAVRWLVFLSTTAVVPVILYHTVEAPMISLGHGVVKRLAVARRGN
jgi:peptidoglycan/LPS O-acetylase OafA/YrhL